MNYRAVWCTIVFAALVLLLEGCSAPSTLTSIQVTPSTAALAAVGTTVQFTAMGTYSNGRHPSETRDITGSVTWASSTPATATVSSSGLATSIGSGTTSITATMSSSFGPVSGNASLSVTTGSGTGSPGTRDLVAITLTPFTQTLNAGQTVQFIAVGTFSAAPTTAVMTNQVAWQSSTVSVATINSTGLATAVSCAASGCVTTITASATALSGAVITGSATITVNSGSQPPMRDLTAITLIPGTQTLSALGETVQFIALGTFSANPTTAIITNQATWQSSTASVASIGATGLATAVGCPTTSCVSTITASATAPISGAIITGTASLTVSPGAQPPLRELTGITIIPSTQTLNTVGETAQLIAVGTFNTPPTTQSMSGLVTWQSSDTSVATVNSSTGQVTAVGCATASCVTTITATAIAQTGIVGTATLNVSPGTPPAARALSAITIIPGTGTQTLGSLGETAQFIAIGTFTASPTTQELTGSNVAWQSSDVQVATIDSSGLATAVNCAASSCISYVTASSTLGANGDIIIGTSNVTGNPGSGSTNLRSLTVYEVGSGIGMVVSSPTGINCSSGAGCTGDFPLGTSVTLTATPNSGSSFVNWSSNCTPTTSTTCTLVMNSNQNVGAIFN
jgi:hypothetical protein